MVDVIVYGAGGHCKAVIATLEEDSRYRVVGLLDDDVHKHGKTHYGYEVLGGQDQLSLGKFDRVKCAFVAIGDNQIRARKHRLLSERNFELINVIHPSSVILRGSVIDDGSLIFPHAFVGSDTRIGKGVIVSVGVVVGHDVQVKDFGHITPHVSLSGGVIVGEHSFIGTGSIILPGVEVADHVIVGANSVVNRDLPAGVTAVGSPVRIINRSENGS